MLQIFNIITYLLVEFKPTDEAKATICHAPGGLQFVIYLCVQCWIKQACRRAFKKLIYVYKIGT